MRGFLGLAIAGLVSACNPLLCADAEAADGKKIEVFGGADLTEKTDAQFGFLGVNAFLIGGMEEGGLLAGITGGFGHYDYPNGSVAGGVVDGYITSGGAVVGYKAVQGDLALTGRLGVEYRDRNLSPDDPFSDSEGDWFGAKGSIEGEYDPASGIYASGIAEYSTINGMYYGRLRAGPDFGSVVVGPEFALVGEEGWEVIRYGGFARLETSPLFNLSLAAGNASNTKGAGGEGYYLSAGFDVGF